MKFARWGVIALSAPLALVLAAPVQAADGNVEAGRVKANTCMGCHGIPKYYNVYPTYRVPKLGGQSAEYIAAALNEYKRSEEHTSELQSLMRISYAVFCLTKKHSHKENEHQPAAQ